MNTEERGKLLRERFKAKGGQPYPKSKNPRRPKEKKFGPHVSHMYFHGASIYDEHAKWVKTPEAKPKPNVRLKHRGKDVSHLIKIATQLPRKLLHKVQNNIYEPSNTL